MTFRFPHAVHSHSPSRRAVPMAEDDGSPRWGPLVLILLAVAGLTLWDWRHAPEGQAFAALSPEARQEKFLSTRRDADGFCAHRELRAQCRTQLELLVRFPECDEESRFFAARMRRSWRP